MHSICSKKTVPHTKISMLIVWFIFPSKNVQNSCEKLAKVCLKHSIPRAVMLNKIREAITLPINKTIIQQKHTDRKFFQCKTCAIDTAAFKTRPWVLRQSRTWSPKTVPFQIHMQCISFHSFLFPEANEMILKVQSVTMCLWGHRSCACEFSYHFVYLRRLAIRVQKHFHRDDFFLKEKCPLKKIIRVLCRDLVCCMWLKSGARPRYGHSYRLSQSGSMWTAK